MREDLITLPGESWSWQRHAKEHLFHHCGCFRTLRRVIVMVAGALDEGRIGGLERHHAMLCQIYRILESAAKDSGHDLTWGWPWLGLADPDAGPDIRRLPAEASAVIAWNREAAALETAKRQLMIPIGKATPKVKSEHLSDDDDSSHKSRFVQRWYKSLKSCSKAREATAQRPKTAWQSETGS